MITLYNLLVSIFLSLSTMHNPKLGTKGKEWEGSMAKGVNIGNAFL